MTAARHSGEDERLAALHAYAILDTPPEAGFEQITSMVKRHFGVRIAAVSLIDAHRQWFKSVRGLETQEMPREHSFCAYKMWGRSVMVVPDATADLRFKDNPYVTGPPGVRFYAGAPLRSPEGHPLGALCIFDLSTRHFSRVEQQILTEMAVLVEDELLLRRAAVELRIKKFRDSSTPEGTRPTALT